MLSRPQIRRRRRTRRSPISMKHLHLHLLAAQELQPHCLQIPPPDLQRKGRQPQARQRADRRDRRQVERGRVETGDHLVTENSRWIMGPLSRRAGRQTYSLPGGGCPGRLSPFTSSKSSFATPLTLFSRSHTWHRHPQNGSLGSPLSAEHSQNLLSQPSTPPLHYLPPLESTSSSKASAHRTTITG